MPTITIPSLEGVSPSYKKALQRRRRLLREEEEMRADVARETHNGNYATPSGLTAKADALAKAHGGAIADLAVEKLDAKVAARTQLEADPAFRSLVKTTAAALCERIAPLLEYEKIRTQAGIAGVTVVELPPSAAREASEVVAWLREQIRRGTLTAGEVPAHVRALVSNE